VAGTCCGLGGPAGDKESASSRLVHEIVSGLGLKEAKDLVDRAPKPWLGHAKILRRHPDTTDFYIMERTLAHYPYDFAGRRPRLVVTLN
jgi:hypothetical protein